MSEEGEEYIEEPTYEDGGDGYGDEYQEVEHEGYFEKLGSSFAGICIGIVLFFGAFPLLWWNEGRAVDYYQAIKEGRGSLVNINSNIIDSANDGKLVYITGLAEPTKDLNDTDFSVGVTEKISLIRSVEVYQWYEQKTTEKKDKYGGGTTTVTKYNYYKQWRSDLVNSGAFKVPSGHVNPTSMPYTATSFYSDVILDAFTFPQDLLLRFPVDDSNLGSISYNATNIPSNNILKLEKNNTIVYDNGFYFGNSVSQPQIGDTRVQYQSSSGGTVSIVAEQSGSTFIPYRAKSGADLYIFELGRVSADRMFDNAEEDNKTSTMILRFVGAIVMIAGISLILSPLSVAADIIPCVGDCVGAAIGIVALIIGSVLSLIVIGIAWVANRPIILGVSLVGLAIVGYFVYSGFQKKRERGLGSDSVKDLEMERDDE